MAEKDYDGVNLVPRVSLHPVPYRAKKRGPENEVPIKYVNMINRVAGNQGAVILTCFVGTQATRAL